MEMKYPQGLCNIAISHSSHEGDPSWLMEVKFFLKPTGFFFFFSEMKMLRYISIRLFASKWLQLSVSTLSHCMCFFQVWNFIFEMTGHFQGHFHWKNLKFMKGHHGPRSRSGQQGHGLQWLCEIPGLIFFAPALIYNTHISPSLRPSVAWWHLGWWPSRSHPWSWYQEALCLDRCYLHTEVFLRFKYISEKFIFPLNHLRATLPKSRYDSS